MVRHTLTLLDPSGKGPRLSIRVLRVLSEVLVDAAQRSLRLRVTGRSTLGGRPSWIATATDFYLVGLREGSTILDWEAPTLGEAAPELFQQLQLPVWHTSPKSEQSALMLVEDALRDATSGNAESDILDRNILNALGGFRRLLDLGVSGIKLCGGLSTESPLHIGPSELDTVYRLEQEAPPSQRTLVSGVLDQLTGSRRAFILRLETGQSLRGILPPGDPHSIASLFTRKVIVNGEVRFRPSGGVSMLIAETILPAASDDTVWERIPQPQPRSLDELKPRIPPPPGANGMKQVFGRWPGSESTEELLTALAEIG